jgi:hypothetical protein
VAIQATALPGGRSAGSDLPRNARRAATVPDYSLQKRTEMLDTFGIQQGGTQYRRLIDSFQRIFGATILFGTDIHRDKAVVFHQSRFNFMDSF